MLYPASVSALSTLPSTTVVRLVSLPFSSPMFPLFVAMSFVFVATSDALAYVRSATSLLTFLSNSLVTSCVVKTSYVTPLSTTCTVASATPNPPQRRESAIRDARRERLVTPPNFFRAGSRLRVRASDFRRYHIAIFCLGPDDFVDVVHDDFPLCEKQ